MYQLVRMRHPGGVPAHDVEVGSCSHASPGMPLDLKSCACQLALSFFRSLLFCATENVNPLRLSFDTSVGPAYIMGLGKMAMTVESLSSSPSSRTALCCSILVARGTSSSLVHPPRGCNSRTGRLYPLDSNWRLGFVLAGCNLQQIYLQSDIRRACPLWIGLRSWKAKTASAFSSLNRSRNWFKIIERHPVVILKNLMRSEPELIEAILPSDPAQHFQVPSNQPGTRCHDHLD